MFFCGLEMRLERGPEMQQCDGPTVLAIVLCNAGCDCNVERVASEGVLDPVEEKVNVG